MEGQQAQPNLNLNPNPNSNRVMAIINNGTDMPIAKLFNILP
jgi:hypothetical protein